MQVAQQANNCPSSSSSAGKTETDAGHLALAKEGVCQADPVSVWRSDPFQIGLGGVFLIIVGAFMCRIFWKHFSRDGRWSGIIFVILMIASVTMCLAGVYFVFRALLG
jgi:hypothetical protein